MLDHCHGQLEGFEASIKVQLIDSPVVHFVEMGMKINKAGHWLHVANTNTLTYYYTHPKRGVEAMDEIGILPQFTDCAIHDHWSAYFRFRCYHSLCNAHHLRELIYVQYQYNHRWAARLQQYLLQAKEEVDESKRCGRAKQHRAKNLHDRLKKQKYEALAFIYDLSVPFDNNNLGERDIRMNKVKQKISGCSRSVQGPPKFDRIRSYISTARKQGNNVLALLLLPFRDNPSFQEVLDFGQHGLCSYDEYT
jgi:transposase